MKVLLVTKPHLPILGGGQLTVHWLALALIGRGHSVEVLSHQRPGTPQPETDRAFGYLTMRPERPDLELPTVLERFAPDVVVINLYGGRSRPWMRRMVGARHTVPAVPYLHDVAGVPLLSESRARPELVLAVSGFVAAQATAGAAAVRTLPPIVERARYRVDSSREVALFVTPVPVKGLDTALALARARPDVPFAFQRCWPTNPQAVAELVSAVEPLPNVQLRDGVLEPELIYRDARVVLVPSAYPEAFGRVAAEARASAIPVIAADVGGLPESAGEHALLVAPDGGPPAWEAALARLWDHPDRYGRTVVALEADGTPGELSAATVARRFEELVAPLAGVTPPSTRVTNGTSG